MTLSLAKHLRVEHAALARGEFDRQATSRTLHGAVCGILGFGGIGQAIARLMRAFGARIHAVNTSGRTSEPVDWVGTLGQLDQLLAVADVLVIAHAADHGHPRADRRAGTGPDEAGRPPW